VRKLIRRSVGASATPAFGSFDKVSCIGRAEAFQLAGAHSPAEALRV
jgi:hypothetical protein